MLNTKRMPRWFASKEKKTDMHTYCQKITNEHQQKGTARERIEDLSKKIYY